MLVDSATYHLHYNSLLQIVPTVTYQLITPTTPWPLT